MRKTNKNWRRLAALALAVLLGITSMELPATVVYADVADDTAGEPAGDAADEVTGESEGDVSDAVAGEPAGDAADEVTGEPEDAAADDEAGEPENAAAQETSPMPCADKPEGEATAVAQVGDGTYTDFQEAVAAWLNADNATLTLLQDVSYNENQDGIVIANGTRTLDLHGHALDMSAVSVAINVKEGAELTICDSGEANQTGTLSAQNMTVWCGGKFHLTGGSLKKRICVTGIGICTMTGGSVSGSATGIDIESKGTLEISGGSLEGRYGIWNTGRVTISGDPEICGKDSAQNSGGAAIFNNGTMTISDSPSLIGDSEGELHLRKPVTLKIQPEIGKTWSVYMYSSVITEHNGVFTTADSMQELDADRFTSKVSGYYVDKAETGLKLVECAHDTKGETISNQNGTHVYCKCGMRVLESIKCMYTYSSNDETKTITKVCAACGDTAAVTLTLPNDAVYNGKAHAATVSGDEVKIPNELIYAGMDGTEYSASSAAPSNAGNYQVTMTATEGAAVRVSANFTIQKAKLKVTKNPTINWTTDVKYKPGAVLDDVEFLDNGTFKKDEATDVLVSGTWSWQKPETELTVGSHTCTAVFTDENGNYESVTTEFSLSVAKATPMIDASAWVAVAASERQFPYGKTLGEISLEGLRAYVNDKNGKKVPVSGTFSWDEPDKKPPVCDAYVFYGITFTPEASDSYETAKFQSGVIVSKGTKVVNAPDTAMTVANSITSVGAITLPQDWEWQEADREKALEVGKTVTAAAIYAGADKANYEEAACTVEVSITRQKKAVVNTGGGSYGGSSETSKTETKADGSMVTTTEKKNPDGSTETKTETKKTDGSTETKTETKKTDGSTETKTETKNTDGSTKTKTEVKKTDGSTETKTEVKNADGSTKTTTQVKGADGAIEKKTETVNADGSSQTKIVIQDETTKIVVNTQTQSEDTDTQTSASVKQVSDDKGASVSADTLASIVEAAGGADIDVSIKVVDSEGSTVCKVSLNTQDFKVGKKLKVLKIDSKTGELSLVNNETYKVDKDGNVSFDDLKKASYQVLTADEVNEYVKQVLDTVKPETSKTTISEGKKTTFTFDDSLNMDNVQKIIYKTLDKSVATVDKNGKIKTKKSGKVTIKATVTLKNGKKKTVKMTITVKAKKETKK